MVCIAASLQFRLCCIILPPANKIFSYHLHYTWHIIVTTSDLKILLQVFSGGDIANTGISMLWKGAY